MGVLQDGQRGTGLGQESPTQAGSPEMPRGCLWPEHGDPSTHLSSHTSKSVNLMTQLAWLWGFGGMLTPEHPCPCRQEIWQLWVKLRQDEPQLLDNLEEFLAKMRHRIQEARSEKEALELALNK